MCFSPSHKSWQRHGLGRAGGSRFLSRQSELQESSFNKYNLFDVHSVYVRLVKTTVNQFGGTSKFSAPPLCGCSKKYRIAAHDRWISPEQLFQRLCRCLNPWKFSDFYFGPGRRWARSLIISARLGGTISANALGNGRWEGRP